MANSLTYPVPAITGTENLSAEQIHQLLQSKSAVARRVRTLADQKFISDALLTGQYRTEGGAILYETGEPIFPEGDPEVIAPGGEYPQEQITTGELAAAKVDKWGKDYPITDESIKRRGIDPVNKTLTRAVNGMVRHTDGTSLGVIASKVTATSAASAGWTTASAIARSVELAKARGEESGEGHVFDTIVLTPTNYATVMSLFLDAGLLPREAANPLITGKWPEVLDMRWLRSAHVPTSAPMLVDSDELGGMANENLGGPGYASAGRSIETKVIRDDKTDSYLVRVRRVSVAVVTDPSAGVLITGTGL